jgi:outer membrane protein TolC
MSRRGLTGVLLALALPLGAALEIPFAEELFPDLAVLVEAAGREGIDLRLADFRIEERLGDLDAARARRLPNARLYARVSGSYVTREDIDDEFRGSMDASFQVVQPLLHWGRLQRQEAIAGHWVAIEEQESERLGVAYLMDLRRDYLHWRLMLERREILRKSIEVSSSFVEARRRMLEAGDSSEHEVLEMETRLLENQESLAWVERMIVDLGQRIARRSGLDPTGLPGESPPLEVIRPLADEAFAELERRCGQWGAGARVSLDHAWDLRGAVEQEHLSILDKRHWPVFDFVAGVFTDQLEAVNVDDTVMRVGYFAGVQVNWNVFDGWETNALKRSTLARKRAHELRREDSLGQRASRAATLLAELRLNRSQIEVREKRQGLIERRTQLLRQQADRDLVSGTDLMEGEIHHLEVTRQLLEARVNYLVNLMELGVLLNGDPALAGRAIQP